MTMMAGLDGERRDLVMGVAVASEDQGEGEDADSLTTTLDGHALHAALASYAVPTTAEPVTATVRDVVAARWEGFKRLAKTLPDRQILAVELFRTPADETIAVLVTVRNGEPVRTVITGDARGQLSSHAPASNESFTAPAWLTAAVNGDAANPVSMALGQTVLQQAPTQEMLDIGRGLLGAAFNVAAELASTAS